ncbi:PAS domain-containing hybrid sensor histidine kinase/response regulator [Rhodopirellula sallentina]|uniref:histidine kinase n=1 Tax=Rhodopirellula sallentina SM41 TaxID=1263870 RepID=M5TRJ8_9BACT|nr:PAS domain-containing hybrid sensor histidine kinase/response regulator [Rhodopirellula sallentina]EMI51807.1 multi-sensor hybrid histidine kinase [Rhodopirellula sallentina SM41]
MSPTDSSSNERDLQTSATYRALANSLPLSVLIKSNDGRRVFANEAYLKWRNLCWEDVAGKLDSDLFDEEIARKYTEDDRRVLESGQAQHAVEQASVADGSIGWIERVKSPIYDANGKLLGIQVLFWDVTARVQAENKSRFEQSLLNTLLENIPDSIYFKDLQSRFIRVSRAMAEKFGYHDPQEIIAKSDADIFTLEHAEQARKDELEVIETGVPLVDRVERETWPERDDTWCMTTKMPLVDEDGDTIGTFGISRDITALKRSEAALKEAVRMADAANRAKSEFLANMSHEIRTPMNALVGMADLLAQTDLSEVQSEYVDTIRRSSDSLLRLLNDILDFSKIEARKLELEAVPFSLGYEIQAAISTLRYQGAKKNLELRLDYEEGLPHYFVGDPGRIRQILINLIGNAVKFTDRGGVTVVVKRLPPAQTDQTPVDQTHPEEVAALEQSGANANVANESDSEPENESDITDGGKTRLLVSIVDTGIGISPEQQASVLAPFTQADASMTRRFGGTGLGLSISRQLVELMGGTLQLRSELGVGTTFFFDLELSVADHSDMERNDDDLEEDLGGEEFVATQPLRVLVAEDGVTNQHVIAGLLRSLGHECSIASDGRETLSKWRNETYDVILMDMHMPVMDGLEATVEIRQQEMGTDHHIPIIALTAAAMAEDARLCREAGMDDYLTKPIRRRKLHRALEVIHPIGAATAAVSSSASAGSGAIFTSSKTVDNQSGITVEGSARFARSLESADRLVLGNKHAGCLDLDSARSRIPGGVSGVLRLAAVFKEECQSLLDLLETDISSGDNDSARRNAHTLKGACGLLGAKQLQAAAGEIEEAGREGRLSNPDEAGPLLQSLQTEANRVLAAVDELLQ